MLPRQPLRFLLADDPGAGKTIMAGLLIKELLVRGDLHRCLIVCPGMLAEQWQDELNFKFHLPFEILTNDKLESARTGNWFLENPLAICRLDKLSRDEDVQAKLEQTDWDLIVVDEAHKMSASFFSGEIKPTKRYKLGQQLSGLTRHFLLMTATPHNGKEEDFQLFMALLDGDRFEGRFRDGVHQVDVSDLMRRLVKEQLLKFDGTPLFPERLAYTVPYPLSDLEARLYKEVTDYVREEFNRADALDNEGRKGTVGFALTILQRRLASSPEAIYQSLRRRRERLEKRLREEQLLKRGGATTIEAAPQVPSYSDEDMGELDDAPSAEIEQAEQQVIDQATAARTIAELEAEIAILRGLEDLALRVRQSGTDRKWEELSKLLQNQSEMFDAEGHRRKLVIFTEQRDTLNYLTDRIRGLIGRPETVVTIHGGMGREDRRKDPNDSGPDSGERVRVLFYLEHSIQDARTDRAGNRRTVSRRMQFVEIDATGKVRNAGYAPYLDYRPAAEDERAALASELDGAWLHGDLEAKVLEYAVTELVPQHLDEVQHRKQELVATTMAAVKDRLTKEINYWDHRANELKLQELAGRVNARINSGKARQRADDLQGRLQKRMEELEQERQIAPLPPVAIGGALVVPAGLLDSVKGGHRSGAAPFARDTERIEGLAMDAVFAAERRLGFEPRDVSGEKCGYDVESRIPETGKLRFIEVKGRAKGADTVTITKNEILTAFNKPEDFILAIVEVDGDEAVPRYVRQPFQREPDFGVTTVNYDWSKLWMRAEEPAGEAGGTDDVHAGAGRAHDAILTGGNPP